MSTKAKSILITGGGSGIGRGLALAFAERGLSVIVTDVDAAAACETVSLIGRGRDAAVAVELDVTRQEAVDRAIAGLPGPIDVLVNNAGMQHVARVEEFPPERWALLIDIMLKGAFLMTRAVLPRMRAAGFGRIVNIGSIHSLVASPFKSAYVAAKHGLAGFAKVVALENADLDITVNTICPSYIRTPLVDKQIRNQAKEHGISEDEVIHRIMLEPMPKKALLTIDEVVAAVAFLLDDLARNITGQTITIDGGWTIK